MNRDNGDLGQLLRAQDNVITYAQATALMTRATLRHRLDAGRWQRAHRGIFIAHNGPVTTRQRRWVAVFAGGNGRMAPLAGPSALEELGMRGYPATRIHIMIPARRMETDPPPGVVAHRTRHLPATDYRHTFPPCTTPARSVVDAASWAVSTDGARALVAAAFQQRLVTLPAMQDVLSRLPTVRRHRLIGQTALDAAGGFESISELEFLDLCREGWLPTPTGQTAIRDVDGRRRYRDAYFEEFGLHVEIDGGQHLDPAAYWADMQRQNAIWIAGDRVLRFPAWAIRNDRKKVIAQIQDALIERGWRPHR